jgi:hypothetical protein
MPVSCRSAPTPSLTIPDNKAPPAPLLQLSNRCGVSLTIPLQEQRVYYARCSFCFPSPNEKCAYYSHFFSKATGGVRAGRNLHCETTTPTLWRTFNTSIEHRPSRSRTSPAEYSPQVVLPASVSLDEQRALPDRRCRIASHRAAIVVHANHLPSIELYRGRRRFLPCALFYLSVTCICTALEL